MAGDTGPRPGFKCAVQAFVGEMSMLSDGTGGDREAPLDAGPVNEGLGRGELDLDLDS